MLKECRKHGVSVSNVTKLYHACKSALSPKTLFSDRNKSPFKLSILNNLIKLRLKPEKVCFVQTSNSWFIRQHSTCTSKKMLS